MNRNMILRAIMLVLASHLLAQHLNAALPTAGEWSATTITGNEIVNLTGDVTVSGTISINNGGKLTINNNTGRTIRITPTATMADLFKVNGGGELVINGNASGSSTINYNGIIIDGGASLTWNNYQLNGTTSFIRHAIYSSGNFDIKNVTIQNIYRDSPNSDTSCNGILSDDGDWASISHCEFKYIRGFEGSAVLCLNANSRGSTLNISDSHFVYCCTYHRLGSTIRSFGTSSTTLSMKNCCVEYCNSNGGHGGAVYWNAHGRTDTCCKFDGCRFLNNRATLFGGGLFIETSVFLSTTKRRFRTTLHRAKEAVESASMDIPRVVPETYLPMSKQLSMTNLKSLATVLQTGEAVDSIAVMPIQRSQPIMLLLHTI